MTKKELKILTGNLVMVAEYSESAKKNLLKLIIESDINQLKKITPDVIDHINEDELAGISHLLSFMQKNPVTTYYLVTSLIDIAHKVYKNILSQSSRACRDQVNKEECIKKFKEKAILAQIQKLTSDLPLCQGSKNPAKCSLQINKKINELRFKLKKIHISGT